MRPGDLFFMIRDGNDLWPWFDAAVQDAADAEAAGVVRRSPLGNLQVAAFCPRLPLGAGVCLKWSRTGAHVAALVVFIQFGKPVGPEA